MVVPLISRILFVRRRLAVHKLLPYLNPATAEWDAFKLGMSIIVRLTENLNGKDVPEFNLVRDKM